jgi:hypothetical protein
MKSPSLSVIGFIIFSLGILSVILSLVGLRFTFLSFLSDHGIISLIVQILMIFGGMALLYVARTSEDDN